MAHVRKESLRERRKRQRRNRVILYVCLAAAVAAVGFAVLGRKKIEISLNGDNPVTVECGDVYEEAGAVAAYGREDISESLSVSGNVDTSKVGRYTLTYTANTEKKEASAQRTVNVVDTTPPELTLEGDEEITVYLGSEFRDPGAAAEDIADGDISESIVTEGNVDTRTEGEYTVTYIARDSSGNETKRERTVKVVEKPKSSSTDGTVYIGKTSKGFTIEQKNGVYYIGGILVANKTYDLPSSYGPGDLLNVFMTNFNQFKADGAARGYNYRIISGYRSYSYQSGLYQRYANRDGYAAADRYSARPGHSEHQTGLAADINSLEQSWGDTAEGKWLANNCWRYGFILRYPKGKEDETGYMYESWHIRYVGVELAEKLYNNGEWLTLEDYLGITSQYR